MIAPPPGKTPMKKPRTEPRNTDAQHWRQSSSVGSSPLSDVLNTSRFSGASRLHRISAIPKRPIAITTKSTPSISRLTPKVKRGIPSTGSRPTVPKRRPRAPIISPLRTDSSEKDETAVFRGPELQGEGGQGRGHQGYAENTKRPGDEGADRRDAQRRAGPSVPGHLVTIQARHHRGRFPGDVQQDRGRGPAVHGPVEYPRQHDHRGDRLHSEGHRQEKGNRCRGTQTRQNADRRAQDRPERTVEKVRRGQGHDKPVGKIFK